MTQQAGGSFTLVLRQQPLPAVPGHPESEIPATYTAR